MVVCFLFKIVIHLLQFIYLFILAVLGLHCCMQAFSSREQRLLSSCGVQASHCGGFACYGAWAVGTWASVVVEHGPSSCSSQALEH